MTDKKTICNTGNNESDACRLTIRIDFGDKGAIGIGKIRLLELVETHGSISAAGAAMGMSYRKSWTLADSLNHLFKEPVVTAQHGGKGGGGAVLTPFGKELINIYRTIEQQSHIANSDI